MKNAWTSNDISYLRTRPQSARWYAAIHRPASVFTANIDSVPLDGASLQLKNTTGNIQNVKPGHTMLIGSALANEASGGSEKGRLRVRSFMSESSIINIAEFGSGLINWKADDKITVIDQFLPWVKHPRYDTSASAWKVDYDVDYDSQLGPYGPMVRMGPPEVGILDGTYTGSYIGASTFMGWKDDNLTATKSDLDTAVWVFPGNPIQKQGLGSPGSLVHNTYSQTLTDGSYFSLTVTDNNGASHGGSRLVWIFDDLTDVPRIEHAQIVGGLEQGGYETQLRAFVDAGSKQFPDMAEVVIFEQASFGNTASNIGGNYPYRSNIVMRGWIVGESVRVNPFSGDVTFRIRTVDGIMEHQESYDTFMSLSSTAETRDSFPSALSILEDAGSSGDWVEAASLTIDKVMYHLVKHRSNLADFTDINFASGLADTSGLILFQDLPRSPFWKQLQDNYHEKGLLGYVAADLQSNVWAGIDAQISGGSADTPLAFSMNKQDRRDMVQIERTVLDPVAEAHLLSVSGSDKYWAINPAKVMGYFGGKKEHSKGLFLHQDDLVQWVGNYRADFNNEYPRNIIPLAGNFRLDAVPQSRISMSLSPADNPRGITWDDEQFFVNKLTLNYSGDTGAVLADIEAEKIVQGIGGSAVTFPPTITPVDTGGGSDVPDPPPPPDEDDILTEGDGFGTVYVMTNTALGRTRDLSASSPSWTDISPSDGNSFNDFVLDPFRPKTTGYLISDSGVWKSSDLDQSTPSWSLVLTASTVQTALSGSNFRNNRHILCSINSDGYVASFFMITISSIAYVYCAFSSDGGDTWGYGKAAGGSGANIALNGDYEGATDYVPHLVNGNIRIYLTTGVDKPFSNGTNLALYRSDNGGSSWTQKDIITSLAGQNRRPDTIHCPYNGNEDGDICYVGSSSSSEKAVRRTTDGGDNLNLVIGGIEVSIHRFALETSINDKDRGFLWHDTNTLKITDNAFSSTTNATNTNLSGTAVAAGGFPYNNSQFYVVTTNGIFVSTDRGENWTDKTGSWALGSFTSDGVIVPVWVSE